jgi:hypothetical protein
MREKKKSVLACFEVAAALSAAALHRHHLRTEQGDDLHILLFTEGTGDG